MNKRISKKLKKEMDLWNKDSKVRHTLSTFKEAWKVELAEKLNPKKKEN